MKPTATSGPLSNPGPSTSVLHQARLDAVIISATAGAAWALGRRDPALKLGAAWYFLRLNATAVVVTVSLARLAGLVINVTRWTGSRCNNFKGD